MVLESAGMAATTRSPRCPALFLGGVALTVLLVLAGCSSSKDDATASTTATSSSPATTTTTESVPAATALTVPIESSPSTVPSSVDGTCGALAETYGLDELQPKNTSSWVDERQRIVVDAQRESALLTTARQGAPADVAPRLATMAGYAAWLATTMQDAGGFSEAVTAIDAYPDLVTVSLAAASVRTWQKANCPQ